MTDAANQSQAGLFEKFLGRLLGRLPIGWLQLTHNKSRLAAAIAGVSFANILVFMQLGFLGALIDSIRLPYEQFNAQVMISGSDANTLADGSPLPRQRMIEALAVSGVESATPLFIGSIDWKQADGSIRSLMVFGIDPSDSGRSTNTFNNDEINRTLPRIALSDYALLDRKTRNVPKPVINALSVGEPVTFETRGRTLTVTGTFEIGGGFSTDGYMVVSDQTFLKLFPQRVSAAPNHVLLTLATDADSDRTIHQLRQKLPRYDSVVRTIDEAVAADQSFQTTQKPVGLIFGFGVVIGIIVGVIIVYQILSTDVADHLREYATFKAIGYSNRFFTGLVLEEAVALAILGFVPAVFISLALYAGVRSATGLPVEMPFERLVIVLLGTIVMCTLSGLIATRRLANANPADLF
ncbi:MAG: ABC transporter permease DevC [Burkholderiaceae bacterium]